MEERTLRKKLNDLLCGLSDAELESAHHRSSVTPPPHRRAGEFTWLLVLVPFVVAVFVVNREQELGDRAQVSRTARTGSLEQMGELAAAQARRIELGVEREERHLALLVAADARDDPRGALPEMDYQEVVKVYWGPDDLPAIERLAETRRFVFPWNAAEGVCGEEYPLHTGHVRILVSDAIGAAGEAYDRGDDDRTVALLELARRIEADTENAPGIQYAMNAWVTLRGTIFDFLTEHVDDGRWGRGYDGFIASYAPPQEIDNALFARDTAARCFLMRIAIDLEGEPALTLDVVDELFGGMVRKRRAWPEGRDIVFVSELLLLYDERTRDYVHLATLPTPEAKEVLAAMIERSKKQELWGVARFFRGSYGRAILGRIRVEEQRIALLDRASAG